LNDLSPQAFSRPFLCARLARYLLGRTVGLGWCVRSNCAAPSKARLPTRPCSQSVVAVQPIFNCRRFPIIEFNLSAPVGVWTANFDRLLFVLLPGSLFIPREKLSVFTDSNVKVPECGYLSRLSINHFQHIRLRTPAPITSPSTIVD
jgi:hypothetical protein